MAAPNDPKTLLIPDEYTTLTYVHDKWIPALFGLFAFSTICVRNVSKGVPIYAGVQKHIGWTAFWAYIGTFVSERRLNYLADRDAVLRHYIELHPEDFPTPERKLVKDLFKPWHPCR